MTCATMPHDRKERNPLAQDFPDDRFEGGWPHIKGHLVAMYPPMRGTREDTISASSCQPAQDSGTKTPPFAKGGVQVRHGAGDRSARAASKAAPVRSAAVRRRSASSRMRRSRFGPTRKT